MDKLVEKALGRALGFLNLGERKIASLATQYVREIDASVLETIPFPTGSESFEKRYKANRRKISKVVKSLFPDLESKEVGAAADLLERIKIR